MLQIQEKYYVLNYDNYVRKYLTQFDNRWEGW